ncbi:MAG: hydrogenase maturation nickel metallochaperone HypA [bacterium]
MSIAQALTELVCQEAKKHSATRVIGLELHIGRYRAIVPETLIECLGYILADTPADGAKIDIVEIPIRVRCPTCDEIRELDEPFLICPVCGELCPEIVSGKELLLHSMEIDD